MARRDRQSQLFRDLIARLSPELQRAIITAWEDIRASIDWSGLREALERQDVDRAIAALNIEPAAFEAYRAAASSAYAQGGALAATTINAPAGSRVSFRFDMTNPRAEEWIRQNVGEMITGLADTAKDVARQSILTGYQTGRHPHSIALDLAGRVVGGKRAGGVIELDGPRADRFLAVGRGMETAEGVKDLVVMRDGVPVVRFKVNAATEARILRAWRAGEAVPPADREISLRQYKNKLLDERAKLIAQKETASAVMSARREEWHQALDKLGAPASAVIKSWRHGGGVKEPRWWHVQANNQQVRGLDTPFQLSNGASIQFAHDPAAPLSETAGCTCDTTFRLDHTWNLS